jgi:hypothetical protein
VSNPQEVRAPPLNDGSSRGIRTPRFHLERVTSYRYSMEPRTARSVCHGVYRDDGSRIGVIGPTAKSLASRMVHVEGFEPPAKWLRATYSTVEIHMHNDRDDQLGVRRPPQVAVSGASTGIRTPVICLRRAMTFRTGSKWWEWRDSNPLGRSRDVYSVLMFPVITHAHGGRTRARSPALSGRSA